VASQKVIGRIEAHVREALSAERPVVDEPDLLIGHDYKHVDRVRRWALCIARGEGIAELDLIEAAALLHDIGLAQLGPEQRGRHGEIGAELADAFLRENALFSEDQVTRITDAIRWHNAADGGGVLGAILRDADKLDALGAVGLMRALTSKYHKPEYQPGHVQGETWGLPMAQFQARFADGTGIGPYIVDQINFQISFYDELHTATARRLGKPLVAVMRAFVHQLAAEITGPEGQE
jgi:uncharacterized protein